MEPEPEGAITVGALYRKGELQLTTTLLQFEQLDQAIDYFTELKESAGLNLIEIQDEELADDLIIFDPGGGKQALAFREGGIISILLANPQVDLMRLAEIQLAKIRGG
jgi:hypothetical protein